MTSSARRPSGDVRPRELVPGGQRGPLGHLEPVLFFLSAVSERGGCSYSRNGLGEGASTWPLVWSAFATGTS